MELDPTVSGTCSPGCVTLRNGDDAVAMASTHTRLPPLNVWSETVSFVFSASSTVIGRAISRMLNVLLTRPANRVKRNDRQYLLVLQTHQVARLLQAMDDTKGGRLGQLYAIGDLLKREAAPLRSKAFEYCKDPFNCAHHGIT